MVLRTTVRTRTRTRTAAVIAVTALCTAVGALPAAQAGDEAATPTQGGVAAIEAAWEMNEPAEATVMVDSGPNRLDAPVNQLGIDTGVVVNGATGYRWVRRAPNAAPASPERVIVIPDNPRLDPRGDAYTVEVRYRTREKFGNITQKGQATSRGGQWKIQNPQGRPSCLFNGSQGRGAARSPAAVNDNAWHVLRCVRTATAVELWIDGVRVARKLGVVGNVDNAIPMTIGGKINCDQVAITCDYFSGDIDYVRVYRG